ncbi:MAG TPA: hypothetical protein VKS81_11315 [Bacteroidota bacterium]|nr:hypothetical protein [Bacteroidota bacterium]
MIGFLTLSDPALGQVWVKKIGTDQALGNPLAVNPLNRSILYAATGHNVIYRSGDGGYTWQKYGNTVSVPGIIKALFIDPRDTATALIGMEVTPQADRIMKSTDAGITWVPTWYGTYNYFGKPVEFKKEHPDTVFTMSNDTLFRSTDFGSSWDTIRTVPGLFNTWCDAEVRPDSVNILFIGDNTSGIWKSTDGGSNWRNVYSTRGEIPCICIDPFNPRSMYASKYGGGGGIVKSTDGGETWSDLNTPIGYGNGWWIACSPVARGYVYFGAYGGEPYGPFVSRDSGSTWQGYSAASAPTDSINSFNYGLMVTDTATVIALQSDGLYKLQYPETLSVTSPRGGELWKNSSFHTIQWTSPHVDTVRIEFSSDSGATWAVAVPSVAGSAQEVPWSTLSVVSEMCLIRVEDRGIPSYFGRSDSVFTLYDTAFAIHSPAALDTLAAAAPYPLTWMAQIPGWAEAQYSLDSGRTWQTFDTVRSSQESMVWNVPDTNATKAVLRLRALTDTSAQSTSAGNFSILECLAGTFALSTQAGWNMISLPVNVNDRSVSALFPSATTKAYAFTSGSTYASQDTLQYGIGYWIKSPRANTAGCKLAVDTISVAAGWNMIGTIGSAERLSDLMTIPPSIIESPLYWYSSGYKPDSIFTPGRGYWIKTSSAGKMILLPYRLPESGAVLEGRNNR